MLQVQWEETMLSLAGKMIPSIPLFIPIMTLPLIRLGILKHFLHSNSQSMASITETSHGNRIPISLPIRFLCIIMEANRAIMTKSTHGTPHLSIILASIPTPARPFLPLRSTMH